MAKAKKAAKAYGKKWKATRQKRGVQTNQFGGRENKSSSFRKPGSTIIARGIHAAKQKKKGRGK